MCHRTVNWVLIKIKELKNLAKMNLFCQIEFWDSGSGDQGTAASRHENKAVPGETQAG